MADVTLEIAKTFPRMENKTAKIELSLGNNTNIQEQTGSVIRAARILVLPGGENNLLFYLYVQLLSSRGQQNRRRRLQVSRNGKVGTPNQTIPMHNKLHLDNNNLEAEGCRHFRQAKWERLVHLSLCKNYNKFLADNNIGERGCRYISMASCEQLA